ncbi:hypothetical protein CERSUDRAFT_120481 [Gelatoporia subvermispora B]|uniref:UvrD-like helicase ATP-binding domain-containing protein n=1 Tax=Ceriporiopsis subvermispora (strain B) TaxID=914234 RepID=M2RAB0_CERS8|nr:hypothetical protein CERSUDRAFT_120481 [Gelatoporia subvermispora B]
MSCLDTAVAAASQRDPLCPRALSGAEHEGTVELYMAGTGQLRWPQSFCCSSMRETQRTVKAPKSAHVVLDMSLFDASTLRNPGGIEIAVSVFEKFAKNPTTDLNNLVEPLSTSYGLFELMLSLCDHSVYTQVKDWLMTTFHADARVFLASLQSQILKQISLYFTSLNWPSHKVKPASVDSSHNSVMLAYPALQAMADLFDALPLDNEGHRSVKGAGAKASKRDGKVLGKTSKLPSGVSVDPKPFADLGVDIPLTRDAVADLAREVLQDQCQVLEHYLKFLRDPEMAGAITAVSMGAFVHSKGAQHPGEENFHEGAYPLVQPMKAARLFKSTDGFGDWHLLMSTRMEKDLRSLNKKDRKLCEIAVRKLKILSNGLFSDDNQRRLNSTSSDVPIYSATKCIAFLNLEKRIQNIKVSLVKWVSLFLKASLLSSPASVRCKYRNTLNIHGKATPHTFLSTERENPPFDDEYSTGALPLPSLDRNQEIDALLVVDEYVKLSKHLLSGLVMIVQGVPIMFLTILVDILADSNIANAFNLSTTERKVINNELSCYVLGRSGTGKTTTMLFKIFALEKTWSDCGQTTAKPRQLFITKSAVLADKVEHYYKKLARTVSMTSSSSGNELTEHSAEQPHLSPLVDRDEERRQSLPLSFGDLTDDHFPLFITVDQLYGMLEVYINQDTASRNQISYHKFLQSYWPHIRARGLDPASVFGEFMGVIKGSELTLHASGNSLSRQHYIDYSGRSQATYADRRSEIYDMYSSYIKLKRQRGELDIADRTHRIICGLQDSSLARVAVDFLYVDEAQDILLIDAYVLRSLCKNANGLFWAGDTAQTISLGSSFNFDELKAFNWREGRRKKAQYKNSPQPETFELTLNYRSHSGIVDCARSVIDLITMLWPNSIDRLAKEQATTSGPKPVFFNAPDCEDPKCLEQFLFDTCGRSTIEFGAEQCILVRDEDGRQRLRSCLGDLPLIFTVMESKGLEFNDVLLYNFFSGSTVDHSVWRTVKQCDLPESTHIKANVSLCRELKSLYVSLTRARNRIWIIDCSIKADPMRAFWDGRDQIEYHCMVLPPRGPDGKQPSDVTATQGPKLSQFAKQSTHDDWERRFKELKMYNEEAVALAFLARHRADAMSGTSSAKTRAYDTAAEAFLQSADKFTGSQERLIYLRYSADCLVESGQPLEAAKRYLKAQHYERAVQHYFACDRLEMSLEIIRGHRQSVNDNLVRTVEHTARLWYLKNLELDKALALFSTTTEALDFMKQHDCVRAMALTYQRHGKLVEAADILLSMGDKIEAVRLLKKDGSMASITRAENCLVAELWMHFSFATPVQDCASLDQLIEAAEDLASPSSSVSSLFHNQLEIFVATKSKDLQKMVRLGVAAFEQQNLAAALFALDQAFLTPSEHRWRPDGPVQEAVNRLQEFWTFARLITSVVNTRDAARVLSFQRLFGYRPLSPGMSRIREGTFIHRVVGEARMSRSRSDEDITNSDLQRHIRESLKKRARAILLEENMLYRAADALPCAVFEVFKDCNLTNCTKQHLFTKNSSFEYHHALLRARLLQIAICHILSMVLSADELIFHKRLLAREIYTLLFPPFDETFGTRHIVEIRSLREIRDVAKAVQESIRHVVHSSSPTDPDALSTILSCLTLESFFKHWYIKSHGSAPCVVLGHPPEKILWLNGEDPAELVSYFYQLILGRKAISVAVGILSLKYITQRRLPIDVNVLCHVLEYLAGSFAVSHMKTTSRSYHGLMLPHTLFLRLSQFGLTGLELRGFAGFWDFVEVTMHLLQEIFNGSGHTRTQSISEYLLFEGTITGKLPFSVHNIFVYRVCRMLTLMGHNIPIVKLRERILSGVTSLECGGAIPDLYRKYVRASSWDDIACAVTQPPSNVATDQLVRLLDVKKMNGSVSDLNGVRSLVYTKVAHIPDLLRGSIGGADRVGTQSTSGACTDASAFECNANVSPHVKDNTDIDENGDADFMDRVDGAEADMPFTISPEIAVTVMRLQAIYRCSRNRQRTTTPGTRISIYLAKCIAEAKGSSIMHAPYRLYFLGVVPLVLAALERLDNGMSKLKTAAKKRWTEAVNAELEEADQALTWTVEMLKRIKQVQEALQPSSRLHLSQDVSQLRDMILEVQKLVSEAGQKDIVMESTHDHIAHAVAMMEPKVVPLM